MRLRIFISTIRRQQQWTDALSKTLGGRVCASGDDDQAWLWHFQASTASSCLHQMERFLHSSPQRDPRLIVVENSKTNSVENSIAYLRETLPMGARLLEECPQIGGPQYYGRTNVHGNPLDTHVAGVCYYFPQHSVPELARILDVYLPTRLALGCQQMQSSCDALQWETVVENTDAIVDGDKAQDWQDVWKSQQKDQCLETYALVETDQAARELQRAYEEFRRSEEEENA